jgi:pyruvate-formate lyase
MASTAQEITKEKNVEGWQGFNVGLWQNEINVRDFIQQNYEP